MEKQPIHWKNDWKQHIEWDRAAYLNLKEAVRRYGTRSEIFITDNGLCQGGQSYRVYPTVYLKALLYHLAKKYEKL